MALSDSAFSRLCIVTSVACVLALWLTYLNFLVRTELAKAISRRNAMDDKFFKQMESGYVAYYSRPVKVEESPWTADKRVQKRMNNDEFSVIGGQFDFVDKRMFSFNPKNPDDILELSLQAKEAYLTFDRYKPLVENPETRPFSSNPTEDNSLDNLESSQGRHPNFEEPAKDETSVSTVDCWCK